MWAYLRGGGLICNNDYLGGGLFTWGLFRGWGSFEDLRYMVMVFIPFSIKKIYIQFYIHM